MFPHSSLILFQNKTGVIILNLFQNNQLQATDVHTAHIKGLKCFLVRHLAYNFLSRSPET